MVCTFFPAHYEHIWKPYLPWLFDLLYPDDVSRLCPEQALVIHSLRIRSPFLALYALAGVVIGFGYACRVFSTTKPLKQQRANNSLFSFMKEADFYWLVAFLSFGTMNLSGLFLHCLVPYPLATGKYTIEQPFLWICDSYSTGLFGLALWAGALVESTSTHRWTKYLDTLKGLIQIGWTFGNVVGVLWVLVYLVAVDYHQESKHNYDEAFGTSNHIEQYQKSLISVLLASPSELAGRISHIASLPLEFWYLGPPFALSSWSLLWMLFCHNYPRELTICFALSFLVFIIAAFDSFVCRRFGLPYLDIVAQPALMFLGTDFVFLGIGLWLESRMQKERKGPKTKLKQ